MSASRKKASRYYPGQAQDASEDSQSVTKKRKTFVTHSKKNAEECALEALLFGSDLPVNINNNNDEYDAQDKTNHAQEAAWQDNAGEDEEDAPVDLDSLFTTDFEGNATTTNNNDASDINGGEDTLSAEDGNDNNAAWVDPEDATTMVGLTDVNRLRKLRESKAEVIVTAAEYERRLQHKFTELHGEQDWAQVTEEQETKQDPVAAMHRLERSAASISGSSSSSSSSSSLLPSGKITVSRLTDANQKEVAQGVVSSVRFHHDGQLMFAAGLDKALRFFQIDGVENPLVQTVLFPDLQIRFAEFVDAGRGVMCVGRRKYIYTCDLVTGSTTKIPSIRTRKETNYESFAVSPSTSAVNLIALSGENGYVVLLDGKTKQWTHSLKMNGQVRGLSFSTDGQSLFTFSNDGDVYAWDTRTRKCRAKWHDEGCVRGTTLSSSNVTSSNYLATGSASGQVNLYTQDALMDAFRSKSKSIKPIKSILNMVDPVHQACFNHDAQLLCVRSQSSKDSVKLIHVASQTVYANWPTQQTPLHYCTSVAFSPRSKYLSLANARGKVLLYRLHHY